MQIGDQVYVRRSDVSRWTSAVVVKLGPKQVYKIQNSDESNIVRLSPKAEIKPLTLQMSEAYKEHSPAMYYDRERGRWMHGAVLEQTTGVAKVKFFSQRAKGEVALWFEEDDLQTSYPVEDSQSEPDDFVPTFLSDQTGIKKNVLYQESDDEGELDAGNDLKSSGNFHTQPAKQKSKLPQSVSWPNYPQSGRDHHNTLTYQFLSDTPFTPPPNVPTIDAYQLNAYMTKNRHANHTKQRPATAKVESKGIPVHPSSGLLTQPVFMRPINPNFPTMPSYLGVPFQHPMLANPGMLNMFPSLSMGMYPGMGIGMYPGMGMGMYPGMGMTMYPNMGMGSFPGMGLGTMGLPFMAHQAMMPATTKSPKAAWGAPTSPSQPTPVKQPPSFKFEKLGVGGMTHVPSMELLDEIDKNKKSVGSTPQKHILNASSSEDVEMKSEVKPSNRPSSATSGGSGIGGKKRRSRPSSVDVISRSKGMKSGKKLVDLPSSSPVFERTAELYQGTPPRVESCSEDDVRAYKGKSLLLSCIAEGDPPPSYKWRHDGVLITSDNSHYNFPSAGFLKIPVCTMRDTGYYVCTVQNAVGSVSRCFHVQVEPQEVELSPTGPVPVKDVPDTVDVQSSGDETSNITTEEKLLRALNSSTEKIKTVQIADPWSKRTVKPYVYIPHSKSMPFEPDMHQRPEVTDDEGFSTLETNASKSAAESDGNFHSQVTKRDVPTGPRVSRADSITAYLYGTDYGTSSMPDILEEGTFRGNESATKWTPKPTGGTASKSTNGSQDLQIQTARGANKSAKVSPPPATIVTDSGDKIQEEVITSGIADSNSDYPSSNSLLPNPTLPTKTKSKSSRFISNIFKKFSKKKTPHILQEAPQVTQEVPQVAQEVPQVAQEVPQVAQEVPQVTQEAPQVTQETPQVAQEAPQVTQEAPQVTQETPQVVQEAPQVAQETPQVVQEAPQVAQEAPQVTQEVPQVTQETPQVAQETPQVAQEVPQVTQEVPQVAQEAPQVAQEVPQVTQEVPQVTQEVPQVAQSEASEEAPEETFL